MITQLKSELTTVSANVGGVFNCLSISELEDYCQNYNFSIPIINLKPIERYEQNILPSGAIRYNFTFNLYFLTRFKKEDTKEDNKDLLIDTMITLSEAFFRELNNNSNQYFINPSWKWSNKILRQYTSNLTCGVEATIIIDTACNRVQ